MKRAPARWEADNPAAYEQGTRSFWLNAFVSQWASWESIILKYPERHRQYPQDAGRLTTPASASCGRIAATWRTRTV